MLLITFKLMKRAVIVSVSFTIFQCLKETTLAQGRNGRRTVNIGIHY